jgi:putative acetyltransferase
MEVHSCEAKYESSWQGQINGEAVDFQVNSIMNEDDSAVCGIIQTVGSEFGAVGDGFGPSDPEVLNMSQHYTPDNQRLYLVARMNGQIVGGCGVAPFGSRSDVCELRKLYVLPEARGFGVGQRISELCVQFARDMRFTYCYLDTLRSMVAAIRLYEKIVFKHLQKPLDGTIHGGCEVWMLLSLL